MGSLPTKGSSNLPGFKTEGDPSRVLSNFILAYSGLSFFLFVFFLVKSKGVRGLGKNFSFNYISINLSMLALSVMTDCTDAVLVFPGGFF